jgi:hypothetical protein
VILVLTRNAPAPDGPVARVEAMLRQKGAAHLILSGERFPQEAKLSLRPGSDAGTLRTGDETISLASVRTVWLEGQNAPVIPGGMSEAATKFARAESAGVLRALNLRLKDRFWVNAPWSEAAMANDPLQQLRSAAAAGFVVPRSMVTNDQQRALRFKEELGGEVAERRYALGTDVATQGPPTIVDSGPVLLQERITSVRDLHVTVIGDSVFAAEGQPCRPWTMPSTMSERCLTLSRALGLAFAVMKLAVTTHDELAFLSLNPRGVWLGREVEAGHPLVESFSEMLIQACVDYASSEPAQG